MGMCSRHLAAKGYALFVSTILVFAQEQICAGMQTPERCSVLAHSLFSSIMHAEVHADLPSLPCW